MIGIYKITNPHGKIYIGQSKDIEQRFKTHKSQRTKNKLGMSFIEFGVKSHVFEVIEECEKSELNEKEYNYIKFYNSDKEGLNTDFNRDNPIVKNETGRKKLPQGEKLVLLRVYVKEKYIEMQNEAEIKAAVELSIERHYKLLKDKN